ncbi:MAG: PP2C family protein-serine/threonine phosphatase [Candidatus Riflebacteria bacterium]|nr:PP2C family protein-serine/threonine phosphatase [Candidatus Riflebacteria bacterium]
MAFPLKRILTALLVGILTFLLFFLVLSVWSFRSFSRFIEVDQRDSLVLGRQYERLMDRWAELSQLRAEAVLEAKPLAAEPKQKILQDVAEIQLALDQTSRGGPHEAPWIAARGILGEYLKGLERFDTLLASWVAGVASRRQEGETFAASFGPRLEAVVGMLASSQAMLQIESVRAFPSSQRLAEAVADLQDRLQAMRGFFGPGQWSKLNQPEIARLDALIESRLLAFLRTFPEDPGGGQVRLHPLLEPVAREIRAFAREFQTVQVSVWPQNDTLLTMEEEIHDLDQDLRKLRNRGLDICLKESDLVWGEIERDSTLLLEEIRGKFYVRFLFLALAILLSFFAILRIPSLIADPLANLRRRLEQVTPGQGIEASPPMLVAEFQALEQSFQRMVRHVNESTALQTRYFETLTRIPAVFSALYDTRTPDLGARALPEQALDRLFPLLACQMQAVVFGQVLWQEKGEWHRGAPHPARDVTPPSRSTGENPASHPLLTRWQEVGGRISTIDWLWKQAVVDPVVITPDLDGPEIEWRPVPWSALPFVGPGDQVPSIGFLGVRCSMARREAAGPPSPGCLLLAFAGDPPIPLSRADRVFLSLLTHQMTAMIEGLELWRVFRRDQARSVQLAMARDIQSRALPTTIPATPWFECEADIRMANEVGGDYFEFFPFPDGRLGVLIADVSGKNVPAALLTMALKAALHSFPIDRLPAHEVVERLNRVMLDIVGGEHFVTLVFVVVAPERQEYLLCNAGHVPVLHRTLDETGQTVWVSREYSDFPLGLFPHSYQEHSHPCRPGDRLILYTDGVLDCQNELGRRLGEDGFLELLRSEPAGSVASMQKRVEAFCGTVPPADDLTLVSVTFRSEERPPAPSTNSRG